MIQNTQSIYFISTVQQTELINITKCLGLDEPRKIKLNRKKKTRINVILVLSENKKMKTKDI